jgi:16S rRNA (cytidine1402-2'-O)-methyltransferase
MNNNATSESSGGTNENGDAATRSSDVADEIGSAASASSGGPNENSGGASGSATGASEHGSAASGSAGVAHENGSAASGSSGGAGEDSGGAAGSVTGAGDGWRRVAARVAAQHWPKATLYVVATPIGNLGDLTLRASHALSRVDIIAAEDTRASRALLDAWGIATPLMPAHRHNEAAAAQAICERLAQGQRVALISDAGAPAVSDPGARIVRAVHAAGYAVVPLPGPSAVIAALMGSGVTSDENPAFAFAGFPPAKTTARQRWLRPWCALPAPVLMFEAPHRVAATLRDLLELCGPERLCTIARELTKRFEEIATMPLAAAADWLAAQAHRQQGEFVLIVHAQQAAPRDDGVDGDTDTLLDALLETVSVRDAARVAARVTGLPRDVLYARALERGK